MLTLPIPEDERNEKANCHFELRNPVDRLRNNASVSISIACRAYDPEVTTVTSNTDSEALMKRRIAELEAQLAEAKKVSMQEREAEAPEVGYYKVFQTLDDGALAESCDRPDALVCLGKIVFIPKSVDGMLYDDKMVRINNPQVIDVLKYENRMGVQKTVPVVVEKKK